VLISLFVNGVEFAAVSVMLALKTGFFFSPRHFGHFGRNSLKAFRQLFRLRICFYDWKKSIMTELA